MRPFIALAATAASLAPHAPVAVFAESTNPDCPVEGNVVSSSGGDAVSITFSNLLGENVHFFWVDPNGLEVAAGLAGPYGELPSNSYTGHVFRARTESGALLKEYRAPGPRSGSGSGRKARLEVEVAPCGDEGGDYPLWTEGRDAEFERLSHDHSAPCLPAHQSGAWSCVRYLDREDVLARNRSLYGFQPGEVPANREYVTYDHSYTAQISSVPKITPASSKGYHKMTMPTSLRTLLTEWYALKRLDALVPHDVIAGGYTNNDVVRFDKLNLDRYREVHGSIVKELQQVLQWWTRLRLKHTSTFGVRVYRRDSMLIDHVDRMDTHLASAVLQVAQEVDEDGGWPLEVVLPNGGGVAEVYLQPGEMVLYEGAWLRHGRPMRFKGDEFANIFSHFAPLDWKGPNAADSPDYYGYVEGRCATVADETGEAHCKVDGRRKPSTVSKQVTLDFNAAFEKRTKEKQQEKEEAEGPDPVGSVEAAHGAQAAEGGDKGGGGLLKRAMNRFKKQGGGSGEEGSGGGGILEEEL